MANSYTFTADKTVTIGNATKKTDIDLVAANTDYLNEAIETIMDASAADGQITLAAGKSVTGASGVKLDDNAAVTANTPFLIGHGKNNAGGTGQSTVPFYASAFSLADDAAATVVSGIGQTAYTLILTVSVNSASSLTAVIRCDMDPSPGGAVASSDGYTVSVVTSALTGTDGVDGEFTVSVQAGAIQVENRLGGGTYVKILLM